MLNYFPGQQPDEKVIMVIRKHFVVYLRSMLIFSVAAILPLIVFVFLWARAFPLSQAGTVGILGYLGACLFTLYGLALMVIAILDDQFDLFILTDFRLIDVTKTSLLQRTLATTPLNQIQDTTSDVKGVLGTLLNYGTVDVKTAAGSASHFMIEDIPDPAMISRMVLNQVEEFRKREMKKRGQGSHLEEADL